ncbi:MAG TPA: TetR family transcriptional regulator [Candidatus Binatia bacterium]
MPARVGDELPQSERKRRAILDAVLRVVAEGGVDAVTHRRVAAEADVPLGSTTYYFASRDDLLREAFRWHAGAVYDALDRLADDVPLRSADDVIGFLVELVRRELEVPSGILVEYELIVRAARDPQLAREVNGYERNLTSRLAEALERLGVAHALEAARILIAIVRGFEIESLTRSSVELADLRRRLRTVVDAWKPASSRATRKPARK